MSDNTRSKQAAEAAEKGWIDKIADKAIEKIKEAPAGILEGFLEIAEGIINGGQQAYNNFFFGEHIRSGASQAPNSGHGIHGDPTPTPDPAHGPTPVSAVEHAPGSFDDRMNELADMYPDHDDHGPDQSHEQSGPER